MLNMGGHKIRNLDRIQMALSMTLHIVTLYMYVKSEMNPINFKGEMIV